MKPTLHACRKGTVAVITAMTLPLLIGFTSLGVEVGHWYLAQRQMQGAADAGAISAAAQYIQDQIAGNTGSTTTYRAVGQSYALTNLRWPQPPTTVNTCLMTPTGDNCGPVLSLDA